MIVSVKLLRKLGACKDQVSLFEQTFGTGDVAITAALCREHAGKFNLTWAVTNLFTCELRDEYNAKLNPSYDEYCAKLKLLRDEYCAKHKVLRDEYDAKLKPSYDKYSAKRKVLRDKYNAKCAELFGELVERM